VGTSLRTAIEELSQTQQVAVLIDRRIDPGQKLQLTLKNTPMESVLQTVAEHCHAGISPLGAIVYFGPSESAARLRSVAAALEKATRRLPMSAQHKLFQSKPFAWNDLATPRDLLTQLSRQGGIEIIGLDRIPHDLWAAADWPPAPLIHRLTLVAVQYDLTFHLAADGSQWELVPIPDDLPVAANPSETSSKGKASSISSNTSSSNMSRSKSSTAANIELLQIRRMTVQDEPLGPVLRQLAERLNLELHIDETAIQSAGISLDRRVSMQVENATVDMLFRELLRSTGLTFSRHQSVVEIVPAEK
jgi:hypothetical protein